MLIITIQCNHIMTCMYLCCDFQPYAAVLNLPPALYKVITPCCGSTTLTSVLGTWSLVVLVPAVI